MLQHKYKLLLVIILTTLLSLVIILFSLIYSNKISLSFFKNLPVQEIKPEPVNAKKTIGKLSNILYPQNPDATGRNVYYLTSDIGQTIKYSGVGINHVYDKAKDNNEVVSYIVGSFDYWEQIPGSKDYYIFLKDLTGVKNSSGQEITFPKYRIGFEKENLKNSKGLYMTVFGVEDLDSVIPKVKDPKAGVKVYNLGFIGNFPKKDLKKLIQPGDTIALTLESNPKLKSELLDVNLVPVISWLIIRRFSPIENITKEVNKEILYQ